MIHTDRLKLTHLQAIFGLGLYIISKNLQRADQQPVFNSNSSRIRRCCPTGQHLVDKQCVASSPALVAAFRPQIINATFYRDCIEDSEVLNFQLSSVDEKPCNMSYVYEEELGEHLYVLQNGSLLIVYNLTDLGFDVMDEYCLDVDATSHRMYALVCAVTRSEYTSSLSLSQFFKGVAIIMIISFVCLVTTGLFYVSVPRFRSLHGLSFALHTCNLACGYALTAINYFKWDGGTKMDGNSGIQYFVSAAFMWQLLMCVDTCINVWYYLPRKMSPVEGRYRAWILLAGYVLVAQLTPVFFTLHHSDDSHGISYYMSTLGDENHDDQWHFFGPILLIIIVCCGLFVSMYYGFRQLNEIHSIAYIVRMRLRKQNLEVPPDVKFCSKEMEYVKASAKSTCFLFAIQSVCFISEVITFYVTTQASIFFELINALQGVFILMIFICLPDRLLIIRQWWSGDQGSFVVENARNQQRDKEREMMPLNQQPIKTVVKMDGDT